MLTFLGNVRKMLPFNCDLKPNYYICLWLNPNSWLKTINTTGIYNRPRKVAYCSRFTVTVGKNYYS